MGRAEVRISRVEKVGPAVTRRGRQAREEAGGVGGGAEAAMSTYAHPTHMEGKGSLVPCRRALGWGGWVGVSKEFEGVAGSLKIHSE